MTGTVNPCYSKPATPLNLLEEFISQVADGNPSHLVGIWLPGNIGLQVIPQTAAGKGGVTEIPNTVNTFTLAEEYGATGLLAHVYQAGQYFSKLAPGSSVLLIYGDGKKLRYLVSQNLEYRSENPTDPNTNFIASDGSVISQADLFTHIYAHPERLVLQTCIIQGESTLWGRKFIIAEPVQP